MADEITTQVQEQPKTQETAKPDNFQAMMNAVKTALSGEPDKPAAETKPAETTPTEQAKEPEKKVESEPVKDDKKPETKEADRKRDGKGRFSVTDNPEQSSDEPPVAQLRKNYETTKGEVARLTKELEDLKKQPQSVANLEEVERLRKERDDALNIVKMAKRELHPEFKTQFVEPLNEAVKKAKTYVPQESQGRLEAILRLPESSERMDALESIVSDLSPLRQQQVLQLANDAARVIAARESALSESSGWFEKQQEREQTAQRDAFRRQKEEWEAAFRDVSQDAAESLELFRLKEKDDTHNADVSRRLGDVRQLLFGEGDQRSTLEAAFLAVAAKEAVPALARSKKVIAERDTTIAELQKELEDLRSKRPAISNSVQQSDEKPDMMSAIRKALGGQ